MFKLYCICLFFYILDTFATPSATLNVTDMNSAATKIPVYVETTTVADGKTTLRPLNERRCFHGFVCKHGICSPSRSRCVCDIGWSGIFCETPCSLDCGENGVCNLHDNGTAFCKCNFQYTGNLCEEELALTSPQILGNGEQTTSPDGKGADSCLPGFPCLHGHCPGGQPKCVCQEGWTGAFCGIPCPLDCGTWGTCSVVGGQQVCVCSWGHTGDKCEDEVPEVATVESVSSTNTEFPTPTPAPLAASSLRPLSERQCVPGFVCKHGVCQSGQLRCVCDDGWVGVFCHTPCNLDCGEHGQCTDTPAGQYCACTLGFTGPRCGSVVNVTLLEPTESGTTPNDATQRPRPPSPAPAPLTTESLSSNITVRPLPLRQCVPGSMAFVCKYGQCYKGQKNQTTIIGSVLECICDPGWIGVFCHEPCPLDCGNNGRCDIFQNGTVYCSCTHEYMGVRCEKLRPQPEPEIRTPSWHWWVVGSCVFLLLVLLLLLIILPYILWKRRFIFIMKIVYMFQPFEDDDDKIFDAFVSYKSTKLDEDFVVHTLYPKLEKSLNFKLCLHFRDFMPGETIANNIINAVENSRRTILILTPSYIQSEFCRFEYQKAQHEMLKRKQRLIPIVLQDISEDRIYMDETLRTILDTITYIDWPVDGNDKKIDKFWKRVELSMPKKRPSQNVSNNNDITLDPYNSDGAYTFPMNFLPETPESDWNPRDSGLNNDSFTDSSDGFHSIDINDDSSSPGVQRRGEFSNRALYNSFH